MGLRRNGREEERRNVRENESISLHVYLFKAQHLCNAIHSSLAKFWWGDKGAERKIHWLAWDRLCKPKMEGGMGFRHMSYFNRALLAKQGWRHLQRPDALVTKLLTARYFPDGDFMHAELGRDPSYAWRSILVGRDEVLCRGLRFQVGNGREVSIWNDLWLPLPHHFRPYSSPMEGTEDWNVCALIDEESMEWIEPVILELFTPEEAALIQRLPQSLRRAADRLFWHYDKHGRYSVKSGYHVGRVFGGLMHSASTSGSAGRSNEFFWKKIWKAKIPPKVRCFVWRMCRKVIPTRAALSKKFHISDLSCVFCGVEVETGLHLFLDCSVTRLFSMHNHLRLKSYSFPGMVMSEWIFLVMEGLSMHEVEVFFMSLWALWVERNKVVWKGGSFDPAHAVVWVFHLLEEFQKLHVQKSVKKKRPLMKWSCPPRGRLKINMDGAFAAEKGDGGVGVIVRDERGCCLAALSRYIPHASSAIHMEAEAIRAGMLIAIHEGWRDIEFESDNFVLMKALTGEGEDVAEVSNILNDCRQYLECFVFASFKHVFREANGVADRLASLARTSFLDVFWVDEIPDIIQDVLVEDECPTTRGLGSLSPSMYYPSITDNNI